MAMSLHQANDSETLSTMRFGSVCRGAAATNAGRNRSKVATKQMETQLNVDGSDAQAFTHIKHHKNIQTNVPTVNMSRLVPFEKNMVSWMGEGRR